MKQIYLKNTQSKGRGVFAGEDIKSGDLIEKCCLIPVTVKPDELGSLYDYVFNYPKDGKFQVYVLPLGAGCIYNHDDNNNAIWSDAKEYMMFDYIAVKDIKKDEEICTHYGDDYWIQMMLRNPKMKKITNNQ